MKFFGPVLVGVLHHQPSLLCHVPNCALGDAILVMRTNAREANLLVLRKQSVHEFLRLKYAVVAMIGLDLDTAGFSKPFKCSL